MKRMYILLILLLITAGLYSNENPLNTIVGKVIKEGWSQTLESWQAGGSEYFVIEDSDGGREILKPSDDVPFDELDSLDGSIIAATGYYKAHEPYTPEHDWENYPIDIDGKPLPRGGGFVILSYQYTDGQVKQPVEQGPANDFSDLNIPYFFSVKDASEFMADSWAWSEMSYYGDPIDWFIDLKENGKFNMYGDADKPSKKGYFHGKWYIEEEEGNYSLVLKGKQGKRKITEYFSIDVLSMGDGEIVNLLMSYREENGKNATDVRSEINLSRR